jgi:hypothetical protein
MYIRRRALSIAYLNSKPKEPEATGSYSVGLNDNWRLSTSIPNPDSSLYDGVYESFSNYNVANSCASLTLNISNINKLTLYVRSDAETYYDYVMVSQLDKVIDRGTSYQYYDAVKAHTRTTQSSGTGIYNYTPVTFDNIGGGDHTITIVYIKDSGTNTGSDRGYVLIGKDIEYYNPSVDPDTPDTPEDDVMDINDYMTIEALEDGLSAMLNANTLEYCIDGSNNWISLNAGSYTPSINKGQKISFRGKDIQPATTSGIGTFTITKRCNLLGNCMSLLFGDNAKTSFTLTGFDYAFYRLFYNCTNIQSVSKDFLPAMALSNYCYGCTFYGCTSLVSGLTLPAPSLASSCYYNMYYGCTAMTDPGIISATSVATYCCYGMYYKCSSLQTGPDLLATSLASYCYYYMFSQCTSLNRIKMLAITLDGYYPLSYWMNGVSSSGTFIKNAQATWTNSGSSGVPTGWTVITE